MPRPGHCAEDLAEQVRTELGLPEGYRPVWLSAAPKGNKDQAELARRRLEAAERVLKTAERRYRLGNVAADEYLKAVLARELAAADLKGDPVAGAGQGQLLADVFASIP